MKISVKTLQRGEVLYHVEKGDCFLTLKKRVCKTLGWFYAIVRVVSEGREIDDSSNVLEYCLEVASRSTLIVVHMLHIVPEARSFRIPIRMMRCPPLHPSFSSGSGDSIIEIDGSLLIGGAVDVLKEEFVKPPSPNAGDDDGVDEMRFIYGGKILSNSQLLLESISYYCHSSCHCCPSCSAEKAVTRKFNSGRHCLRSQGDNPALATVIVTGQWLLIPRTLDTPLHQLPLDFRYDACLPNNRLLNPSDKPPCPAYDQLTLLHNAIAIMVSCYRGVLHGEGVASSRRPSVLCQRIGRPVAKPHFTLRRKGLAKGPTRGIVVMPRTGSRSTGFRRGRLTTKQCA